MNQTIFKFLCGLLVIFAALTIASSAQTLTTLTTFNYFDGSDPDFSSVIQGTDGNFYGTTAYGGSNCQPTGCGTIFQMTPGGTLTTLYSFCAQPSCTDGDYPFAGLIQGSDGNFYGTTTQGGADGHDGTVFKITPTGNFTRLASFCAQTNCTHGNYPTSALVQGTDGNFYGTTFSGGVGDAQYCNGGCGTVFKITPAGVRTTLHTFAGFNTEGSGPNGALIQGNDGNFYGTTTFGGAYNGCSLACGTVFKITPNGALTTLHSFAGYPSDGQAPYGNLALAGNGSFYGTTSAGGTNNGGTVFKLALAGTYEIVYSLCSQTNCADGSSPDAGLALATDGNLYGTTFYGGSYGDGSIFKIAPSGTFASLYSFCSNGYPNCPDGAFLAAGLTQSTSGNFYGTTTLGGLGANGGTVFSLSTGLGPFVTFLRGSGQVGQPFGILGQGFTGTTSVSLNGTACPFSVKSDTFLVAKVPAGSTSGKVAVATVNGLLTSNVAFHVIR